MACAIDFVLQIEYLCENAVILIGIEFKRMLRYVRIARAIANCTSQ